MVCGLPRTLSAGYPLVGEPANEMEKCFRLDSAILHGPPPGLLHALSGGLYA